MNTNDIMIAIDAEISRLQEARALLNGNNSIARRKPGRPAGSTTSLKNAPATSSTPKRNLSPEARTRISDAQKKRWANSKKAAKK